MAASPLTQASLLVRLRDAADDAAWVQFVDVYAPLIYGYVRKRGLQDADAADITQDVLRAVAVAMRGGGYDPARGSFRGWLFTIVRNKLADFQSDAVRQVQARGDSAAHELLMQHWARDDETEWESDYQRRLFHYAAEQVRGDFQETTWQAFWQTAVEQRSGKVVAAELGLSVAAVYLAKSRVMARLKEQVQMLVGKEL
jgi:RNA polymerase sigma-70 factor (ECF subfamily)